MLTETWPREYLVLHHAGMHLQPEIANMRLIWILAKPTMTAQLVAVRFLILPAHNEMLAG